MDILQLLPIAKAAGAAILKIYHDPNQSNVVDYKADDSPLTLADQAANEVIVAALRKNFPETHIISEEGKDIPYEVRSKWETFFLVDPLDGTKEFIKRNGQFTVNIALIENGKPVMGVVYTPVTDTMYYGQAGKGAFKQVGDAPAEALKVNQKAENRIAVRSASHASHEEEEVLNKYGVTDEMSVGSSLKFCMVAEGKADLYYRHGPTMEWDTAAGQAVVLAAGARMYIGNTEETEFTYNKENLLNPGFLVLGF
ncbi:3'(2'),5'-bisphosphate nucleotidase CysQ [Persicobacter diffluens]